MNKATFILLSLLVAGSSASAQNTRPLLQKDMNDPKRAEKEAKADRYLHEKNKRITDIALPVKKKKIETKKISRS